MLSRSSKYAITAVLYLTNNASEDLKIGSKEIAEKFKIPAPFLAKTMQELTKKGIVSSMKGPNGGFYLTRNNKKNTLFQIIDCIDDISKFNTCYLEQHECNEQKPCVVHHLYAPFKDKLINKLKTKTILEMANEFANTNSLDSVLK